MIFWNLSRNEKPPTAKPREHIGEAVTFCHGLKLKSADGKMRNECRNFQNSVWIPMDDLIIQAIRKESADSKGFPRYWTC